MTVRISASRIKTLRTCSLAFWYQEIVKVASSTHHRTQQGSCVHELFEHLMHPKRIGQLRAILLGDCSVTAYPSLARYIRFYDACHGIAPYEMVDMLDMLRVAFLGIKPYFVSAQGEFTPPPHYHNEYQFTFEIDGAVMRGVIDLLMLWPDRAVILDLKSQKVKFPRAELPSNIQAAIYQLAVHREFGLSAAVEFIMLRHAPSKRYPQLHLQRVEPASIDQMVGLGDYLKDLYHQLNDFGEEEAYASVSTDLGWCQKVCSYYRPFDYLVVVKKDDPSETPIRSYPLDRKGEVVYDQTLERLIPKHHPGCSIRYK